MNNSTLSQYISLSNQIKELTAQLDIVKSEIRNSVGEGKTSFENFEVSKSKRFRVDLDKVAVLTAVGAEKFKELEKISEYEVLTVKLINI